MILSLFVLDIFPHKYDQHLEDMIFGAERGKQSGRINNIDLSEKKHNYSEDH